MANSVVLRMDRASNPKRSDISADSSIPFNLRDTMRGIKMKTCTKCHHEKELTEFYPDRSPHANKDGRVPTCKDCRKNQRKAYLDSQQGRASIRRNAKTETSKARQKRYCLNHPERRQAKNAVYWAIRNGKLPHPTTIQCPCGEHQAEQYHHHKGYAKKHWLDVVAVCRKYHTKLHRKAVA